MSITINASVGSSTANSFVTELEQIAYMSTRLSSSAWTTFTGSTCTETEKAAMVSATLELSMFEWQGRRSTTDQVLAWPRWNVPNPDSPVGFLYLTDIVPDRVKNATCELAFQFLNLGTTDLLGIDPTIAIIRKKVDVLETEYAAPYLRAQGMARFPSVLRFIRPLLASMGSSVRVYKG